MHELYLDLRVFGNRILVWKYELSFEFSIRNPSRLESFRSIRHGRGYDGDIQKEVADYVEERIADQLMEGKVLSPINRDFYIIYGIELDDDYYPESPGAYNFALFARANHAAKFAEILNMITVHES